MTRRIIEPERSRPSPAPPAPGPMTGWIHRLGPRLIVLAMAGATMCGLSTQGAAAEAQPKSPWDRWMIRFEFDNDTFLDSDDAFTAGWSLQLHSKLMDRWNPAFAGWIDKVPGLGDDGQGRRLVRWAVALNQIIITPKDLTIAEPQPDDAAWAGLIGVTGTWSSYDNNRLGAIQLYLGCMGPCARAEQVQTFVHEHIAGVPPEGWDNQLSNRALANLNYEYRRKLYTDDPAAYVPRGFGTDLAIGAQGGLGNLTTFLQGEVDFRFGWGMPMGFTRIPDPAGIGMVLDPVYLDPWKPLVKVRGVRIYFNLGARYTWSTYLAPAEGGATENGGHHPPLDRYPGSRQALFGFHVGGAPFSFHATYYRYAEPLPNNIKGSIDWINLSFERRF